MNKPMKTFALSCALIFGVGIFSSSNALAKGDPADYVLTNGKVYTVNDEQPWAEAVAVKGDAIVYVGDNAGAAAFVGEGTKKVDLEGRLTLPGFIESHVHPAHAAAFASGVVINFSDTIEEVLRKVKEYADAHPEKEAIFGATYNGAFTLEKKNFKKMLDDIVPDRPVYLVDHGGHGAWVNSKTLEALGYDKDTVDPEGGIIDRLENGEPSGALKGAPTHINVQFVVPVFTPEGIAAALPRVLESLNEYGFTAATEMGVAIAADASYAAYQELNRTGGLTMRIGVTSYAGSEEAARKAVAVLDKYQVHNSDRLWFDTLKLAFDGVIEIQTSAMLEPFVHNGDTGQYYFSPEVMRETALEAVAKGYNVTAHTFGDAAVRKFLDVAQEVRESGNDEVILSTSHGQFVDPADRPRYAELNVMYETTPIWIFDSPALLPIIGADRYETLNYPLRELLDSGATIVFGSDWPSTIGGYEYGVNPFTNLYHAQTRSTAPALTSVWDSSTAPMAPADQKVTLEEALRAYAMAGAERMGKADMIGSLQVGKKADIIVLSQDLFTLDDITKTIDTTVLLTMFDGEIVHDKAFGLGDDSLVGDVMPDDGDVVDHSDQALRVR